MTTWRRRLAFSAVATALGLGALELLARGYEHLHPPEAAVHDPGPQERDCLPDCVPGVTPYPEEPRSPGMRMEWSPGNQWWFPRAADFEGALNDRGLRGPDLEPRKPGELRLMSVGDSTVFGHGVAWEELFTTVACNELSERWDRPVNPIVAAMPGHDTRQSARMLDRHLADLAPDWVLLGNQWSDLFQADNPEDYVLDEPPPLALYRVLHRTLAPFLEPRIITWVDFARGVGTPAPGREARTPLATYMDRLRAMARHAAREGARPLFIVLPAPIDLDPAGPPAFVRAYREAMRTVAWQLDVPVVEGPRWFRKHEATNAHFFDQVHPSPRGHRLLADALVHTLEAMEPPASGNGAEAPARK